MLNFILSPEGSWETPGLDALSFNRAFFFGDGFFETIRLDKSGILPLGRYHASRISRSAQFLGFPEFSDFTENDLRKLIAGLPKSGEEDRKLKLIFFRKGPGTYAPELPFQTGLFAEISTLSLPLFSRIRKMEKASAVQLFPTDFSWIKSTSALPYVLAGRERREKGADEILLCSPDGIVVEGSFSSLCWEDRDGIHFTPGNLGGVDSCSRRFLEDSFLARGISFTEKAISAQDLQERANWICFCSALGFRFFQQGKEDFRLPEAFSSLDFFGNELSPDFVLPSP